MSNNEEIVFIWLFLIFFIIFLIVFLYLLCRDYYVMKVGYLYNKMVKLNDESQLKFVKEHLEYKKRYNSKSTLDKALLYNVAMFFIEDDICHISSLMERYKNCNDKFDKYLAKFLSIINEKYPDNVIKLNKIFFRDYNDFKSRELKLCNKIRMKNESEITIHIVAYYISPKGQNRWYKDTFMNANDILNMLDVIRRQKERRKTIQYQRDIMTDSLRYKILKRDNFRCQICGASYATDGVRLEVDHIVPVSKGGLTVEDNLQTLCERCNRGKSNRI